MHAHSAETHSPRHQAGQHPGDPGRLVAKLSDLGLAYLPKRRERPERVGKVVGTADYLSPEQIRTPLTHHARASDIYSLGCTLYYSCHRQSTSSLAGHPKVKLSRAHLDETPWHPRRFNEEVSDDFVDLIGDMMEKRSPRADSVGRRSRRTPRPLGGR